MGRLRIMGPGVIGKSNGAKAISTACACRESSDAGSRVLGILPLDSNDRRLAMAIRFGVSIPNYPR